MTVPLVSDPLGPLRHFHPPPEVTYVGAGDLPKTVRELLAHDGDMTSRLARAYGSEIRLQVIQHLVRGPVLAREVVLRTSAGEPVEYGAIEIHLDSLAPQVREPVLAQQEPFGAILNRFCVGYYSAPSAYFSIASAALPFPAFDPQGRCFARCNVLRGFDGRSLARIVEVLSPRSVDLHPVQPARPPFARSRYDAIHLGASPSNCARATADAAQGKVILLLETSDPTPGEEDGDGLFTRLLAARRAGAEVHESVAFRALSLDSVVVTSRDGSEHPLFGPLVKA